MIDLIIVNGRVLTMDPARPRAEALGITGNTIAAIGSLADVMAARKPSTRVLDARGGTVLPGLIESHMHLFPGAVELDQLSLFGISGFEALSDKVRAYAAANPHDTLLIAQAADYTILGGSETVTRQHLDRIVPDRPFLMFAPDHHTAWANTIGLERGGILRGAEVGVGNEIVMGTDGLASGELREGEAIEPVFQLTDKGLRYRLGLATVGDPVPPATPAERAADKLMLQRGLAHLARHGITSFHNMDGNPYTLSLLAELESEGKLTARGKIPFHFKNFMDLDELGVASAMARAYTSEKLHSGFVKVFVDGVIDSSTAMLLDDYADQPGRNCAPLFTPGHFRDVAVEADRRGLQIAVHAIGDGAVRMVLDGYEAAIKVNGARDLRHRIEHIELVHPDDIPRFKALGVVASMQPVHAPGMAGLPMEPTVSRIGRARWPQAYAWRTLRDAGARMTFGTDWPVSPVDPMLAIECAVTRSPWAEGMPEQRQTLDEALRSYTHDSAWVEHMEHRKGMLREGMLADVTVLSGDIESVEPGAIHTLKATATVCDGLVVYEA